MRKSLISLVLFFSCLMTFSQTEEVITKLSSLLDYYANQENFSYKVRYSTLYNGKVNYMQELKYEKFKEKQITLSQDLISITTHHIQLVVDNDQKIILLNKNYLEEESMQLQESQAISLALTELKQFATSSKFREIDSSHSEYSILLNNSMMEEVRFQYDRNENRLTELLFIISDDEAFQELNQDLDIMKINYYDIIENIPNSSYNVGDFIIEGKNGFELKGKYKTYELIKNYGL